MKQKKGNKILEDHGDWLLIDISTPKHPNATMAVDKDVWGLHEGWRVRAFKSNSKYIYAVYTIGKQTKRFHHLVIDRVAGFDIDHIVHGNYTFIDNRGSNLRVATKSDNMHNKSIYKSNTSGMPGVSFSKKDKAWCVRISSDGKRIFLGLFDNIEIAIGVRQQAEKEYFGEYAHKGETP